MLACTLHSLAEQHQRPLSQQTHIPAPGKTIRTKRQHKPCKSQQTRNLWHRGHLGQLALSVVSQKEARGCYLWFHQRMPGGNQEHQPLVLPVAESTSHWAGTEPLVSVWNWYARESSQQVSSSLIRAFCTQAFKWQILQRPNQIASEPISIWRQWSHWKKYFVIWWVIDDSYPRKYDFSIEKSISFTRGLQSNNAWRDLKKKLVCLLLQSFSQL